MGSLYWFQLLHVLSFHIFQKALWSLVTFFMLELSSFKIDTEIGNVEETYIIKM